MTSLRALVTIGLAVLLAAVVGPPMFQRPLTAYTGVHLHLTGAPVQRNVIDVDHGSPAYRAGLRSGDILSCLTLKDWGLLFSSYRNGTPAGYVPGTPVSACVQHGNGERHVQFVADARPAAPPLYHSVSLTIARYLIYVAFLFCGIALVLGRPGTMTWIFFGFCLSAAPTLALEVNGTTLPASLYQLYANLTSVIDASGAGLLLLFALLVPEDVPRGWCLPAYRVAWVLAIAFALLGAFNYNAQSAWTVTHTFLGSVNVAFAVMTILVVISRLFAMQQSERARFGWAAFAIIWGVIANALRSATVLPGPVGTTFGLLMIVMPIALMYAILKRHVIDVRFVISKTVVYGALTTLVVVFIGVVDWLTSAYLHEARVAMAIDAVVTITLGVVLHRTYRWVDHAVDFLLFRGKHEAEEYLHRLARTLPFAKSEEVVNRALVCAPYEKLGLASAALFRERNGSFVPVCSEGWSLVHLPILAGDHDLTRFLMAERRAVSVNQLHGRFQITSESVASPSLSVPIFQSNDLTGFAIYGLHQDGTVLDPDEERAVERLCETAAQAYTAIELAGYRIGTIALPAAGAL